MGIIRTYREYFWSPNQPWASVRSLVPQGLRVLHSGLMCSLRIKVSGFAPVAPYMDGEHEIGAVLVLWHDHTLPTLHLYRDKNIGTLMSRSRAGQLQAAFWRLHGFPTTWGSSTRPREAVQALREAVKTLKNGQCFAFTPDGPKGPRHVAQSGAVWIASNAGAPIIPIGVACSRPWLLATWDKYLVPGFGSRLQVHFGAPMWVPPKLSREETEAWRKRVQSAIDDADAQAARRLQSAK